jgi:hypothetical protein
MIKGEWGNVRTVDVEGQVSTLIWIVGGDALDFMNARSSGGDFLFWSGCIFSLETTNEAFP